MATLIFQWSKEEIRGVIRFLHAKSTPPSKIHSELVSVYGEDVMSLKQVIFWCNEFQQGRSSLQDRQRTGRSPSPHSQEHAHRVEALIRGDRRIKVREIALQIGISKSAVHRILSQLNFRKVSARWVPKELTDDHKLQRQQMSQNLLQRFNDESGATVGPGGDGGLDTEHESFLDHLITGDETWVHHYTPESKKDSMIWKRPSSPPAKKFKTQPSAKKLMATVFWDAKGVLLVDFLPPGESINAVRYCETLDKLRAAVRRKRPGRLSSGVVFQHDNAKPHTANIAKEWI